MGIKPIFERVLILTRRAGTRRASMHATTAVSANGRRFARFSLACLGTTAGAGKHRTGVASMGTRHLGRSLFGEELAATLPLVWMVVGI